MEVKDWLFDRILMMISSIFSEFYVGKGKITSNTFFHGFKSGNILRVHREEDQCTGLVYSLEIRLGY